MSTRPLLVFDTNILMDFLLQRGAQETPLLVELAEKGQVDLVIPQYVLFEFRGTALRWIGAERVRLQSVRQAANEWKRLGSLDLPAQAIRDAVQSVEKSLTELETKVDEVLERIRQVAKVPEHTQDLHFRGDLRYLQGLPPDRPGHGIKDCRIYEAILDVARSDTEERSKILLTRDKDFDYPSLKEDLKKLGFSLRSDTGKLYSELRQQGMANSGE